MNDYIEVRIDFTPCTTDVTDVAAYMLADAGFESFMPDEKGLTAYIRKESYDPEIRNAFADFPMAEATGWKETVVEGQDWNHEWEKNYFKPIVVGDKCVIHSSFHTDIPKCQYDIVIDPKMAFGTGHHSTTWLIISRILEMDLTGKSVIDMGTGTGILAILAAMRGATRVTGIEIDRPAYDNAVENVKLNGHADIMLIHGDASSLDRVDYKADLFLANINRNVITADLHRYVEAMAPGATLLLSGFYTADIPVIEKVANPLGLAVVDASERLDWACVQLVKNN